MTEEQKIDGSEPASEMTINQKALLSFMSTLLTLTRQNPKEVAQQAQRYVQSYLAACNDEIFTPDEDGTE